MPAFSLTPLGTFPPPAPTDFPVGIQWQEDGVNLGDRGGVDTVNLRIGVRGSRGTGETSNILTIDANAFEWLDVPASRPLEGTDIGKGLRVTSATDVVLTVPGDAALDIDPVDGAVSMLIMQAGAGSVTVLAASGVTVNYRANLSTQLAGQYAVITLISTGANQWVVCGDLLSS